MPTFPDRGAGRTALVLLLCWLLPVVPAAADEPMTLDAAQRLAIERDSGALALRSESSALHEQAVASGQLPDPQARVGAVNLPVDSLALDAADMTMIEFGVMQAFPRGRSRALSRDSVEAAARGTEAGWRDRQRQVRLEVERLWRTLDDLDNELGLIAEQARWAGALVEGSTAAYTAGLGRQTDLLDAQLMALELEERRLELERERDVALAGLARWIGDAAYGRRAPAPAVLEPAPLQQLLARIDGHPLMQLQDSERDKAGFDLELAAERYKPAFGVDLSYGMRRGRGMNGEPRPDMLSAMLTFDLPLFTRDRQDREADSARLRLRAAQARREDTERDLQARLSSAHAQASRLAQLQQLYETRLQDLAGASIEAALAAYRASDGSLAEVVATERRLLDLRERLSRTRREHALAVAEIDYLVGDTP